MGLMLIVSYTFSYGVGFLGSLAYMRMLGSSVDSMADGARGLLKYVTNDYLPCLNATFMSKFNDLIELPFFYECMNQQFNM